MLDPAAGRTYAGHTDIRIQTGKPFHDTESPFCGLPLSKAGFHDENNHSYRYSIKFLKQEEYS